MNLVIYHSNGVYKVIDRNTNFFYGDFQTVQLAELFIKTLQQEYSSFLQRNSMVQQQIANAMMFNQYSYPGAGIMGYPAPNPYANMGLGFGMGYNYNNVPVIEQGSQSNFIPQFPMGAGIPNNSVNMAEQNSPSGTDKFDSGADEFDDSGADEFDSGADEFDSGADEFDSGADEFGDSEGTMAFTSDDVSDPTVELDPKAEKKRKKKEKKEKKKEKKKRK